MHGHGVTWLVYPGRRAVLQSHCWRIPSLVARRMRAFITLVKREYTVYKIRIDGGRRWEMEEKARTHVLQLIS